MDIGDTGDCDLREMKQTISYYILELVYCLHRYTI